MAVYNTQERKKFTATITIAVDNDLSDSVDLGRFVLDSFQLPAGMTSTAITFEVSDDDITFTPLRDASGTALNVQIDGTAATYALNPQNFAGQRYVKIATNAGEGADRVITLYGIRVMR